MLRTLSLLKWKSFGEPLSHVPFSRLTLLVGPNASGKSNVLDALRFLQGLALDLPVYEVLRGRWEGGREVWTGIRGGEAEAAAVGTAGFLLETTWEGAGSERLVHSILLSRLGEVAVHSESLLDEAQHYYFDTHAASLGQGGGPQLGGAIRVALRSKPSGRSAVQVLKASRSLLGQIEPAERVDNAVFDARNVVRRSMRELFFFDLQPRAMRQASTIGAPSLGVAGENLSAILHGMPDQTRIDLVDWLSELCAPRVDDITFEVAEHSRAVFFLLLENGGKKVSSSSVSDGTLRFLGILAALLSVPPGSTCVFEEPDVGLHPARVHLLAELLENITMLRGIQVIATTHSPGLLAHLSDEALGNVVAFDRDPTTGCTVCKRAGDLPNFEVLRSSRERDHLFATGWLERAV